MRLFIDDREIARVVDHAPLDDLPSEHLAQPPRDFRIEWCLAGETAPQEIYLPDPRSFATLEAAAATVFAEATAQQAADLPASVDANLISKRGA